NYRRARTAIERYIQLAPSDAEGHFVQGTLYALEGAMDAAERSHERAAHLDPRRAAIHLALGQCYLYHNPTPPRLEQAARCFEGASHLAPGGADIRCRRGLAGFPQGRWRQSVETLQQARRLDPHSAQTYYILGQAYLHLGDRRQSGQYLARYEQLQDRAPA